jgi:hypothetical protein
MKVTLNVADDDELRATVKDMIRGQVLAIAREEITSIIAEAVKKSVIVKTGTDVDKMFYEEIQKHIKSVLGDSGTWGRASWIQNTAKEIVKAKIDELIDSKKLLQ